MPTTTDLVAALTPEQRRRLIELSVPRIVPQYMQHIPHAKQQFYLSLNSIREVMYGGSAGGGKSDALLMAALQYVDVPGYSALILRRTWPDLNAAGAILDRTRGWLADTDAKPHDGGRWWSFPSGARLSFGYMLHENDKFKFQSAEYQFVGWDELTQFQESQYTYMFSRTRRPAVSCLTCGNALRRYGKNTWKHITVEALKKCRQVFPDPKVLAQYTAAPDGTSLWDVPLRVRSATNPGGVGHEWVHGRFIDPKTKDQKAIFVPASLRDNPSVDQQSYIESLQHLLPVDRERLLNGDWEILEAGDMFQRSWFNVIHEYPQNSRMRFVRYWDCAATDSAGDWSVGTLMGLLEGRAYILDQVRGQWSGMKLETIMRQTAMSDGMKVQQRMEQEPGSAGKNLIDAYRRSVFLGFSFDADRVTGSKTTRATPLANHAQSGNVFLLAAQWNKQFLDEFDLFPGGANDDQVDSASGAFNHLTGTRGARLLA